MISILGLVIISIIVLFWFWKLVQMVFIRPYKRKQLANLPGTYREGKIIESNASFQSSPKRFRTKIKVAFENLAGAEVTHSFVFIDSKPLENRYLKDNRISLVITDNSKSPIRIEGSSYKFNVPVRIFQLLLFAAYCYGVWAMYVLIWMGSGESIEGLQNLPTHFVVPLLGGIYFFVLLLVYFIFRSVGIVKGKDSNKLAHELKFHGLKTIGNITDYKATGTRVNNNPMVKLGYTFQTNRGENISGSDKIIVNELEAGMVSSITEREVIYLPNNPQVNKLSEALGSSLLSGCSKYIFLMLAFVFSCVVMGTFIGSTFF